MTNNMKLITTEKFGDLDCSFYRNMNNDILLTREQIGAALEYADPSKAIRKIHLKHQDRLEPLCLRLKLSGTTHIGANLTKSEEQVCVYYTQRGIMEICRHSRQPKANQFMDWVWDIVEKYRSGELSSINLTPVIETLTTLTQAMAALAVNVSTMQQDITTLKESQQKKTLPEKKYSRWKTNTFTKLNILHAYVNEHADENLKLSEIIHLVIGELEDTYNIELNDYMSMYKSEFDLKTMPYTLDVINHYKDIRDMFTLTLDTIMENLHIRKSEQRKENIFNVLAQQLEEEE